MMFKGFKFRKNKNIVELPKKDENGNGNPMPYMANHPEYNVVFGRIVKKQRALSQ